MLTSIVGCLVESWEAWAGSHSVHGDWSRNAIGVKHTVGADYSGCADASWRARSGQRWNIVACIELAGVATVCTWFCIVKPNCIDSVGGADLNGVVVNGVGFVIKVLEPVDADSGRLSNLDVVCRMGDVVRVGTSDIVTLVSADHSEAGFDWSSRQDLMKDKI